MGKLGILGKAWGWGKTALGFGAVGVAAAGTGAVATEQLTDKGAGGWLSNFVPKILEKTNETLSPEQGRNSLLDNFFAGSAKFAGFMGFISGLVSFFSPAMGKKIDDWMVGRSERISEISRELAENGTGRDTPASPGPDSPATMLDQAAAAAQNAMPEGVDGSDVALGAAALGGAALVLKKGLGSAASAAVTPATLAASAAAPTAAAATGAAAPAAAAAAPSLAGRAANALLGTTALGKAVRIAALVGTVGAAGALAEEGSDVDPSAPAAAPATPASAAAPADPSAATPSAAAPEEVSLLSNPMGFLGDMGEGVSSLVKERPDGGMQVDWANVGDAAQNNVKAAAVGLTSTAGWLGGQFVDALDSTENFLGLDFISSTPDTDFSATWSAKVTETTSGLMNDYVPGGAPDMSGAWAQTFGFAGGMAAGGVAAKGLGIAGRLSSLFRWNAAGNATTTVPAAAPRLGMQ